MKLFVNNQEFEGQLPEERIAFKIQSNQKMFEILSSGIYRDKILAVIRELCCNAYDAHVAAGKQDIPFTVKLPNRLDSTFYVEDVGTGIDPEKIGDIFWTYGQSSKTDSNEYIGALGLGSKSPFAYTQSSFIVKNRYQNNEYTYLCFINETGMPDGSLVNKEPTEKLNGITVEFAVRSDDINAFYDRMNRVLRYWNGPLPTILGVNNLIVYPDISTNKVLEGTDWYLSTNHANAIALMGNVSYPIEANSIPNLPSYLEKITNNNFIITFPLGELGFAASRESLQYDEFTSKKIIAKLEKIRSEISESFKTKVYAAKTITEFYTLFAKSFLDLKLIFGLHDDNLSIMLFGSTLNVIEFQGQKLIFQNLIDGIYSYKQDTYQNFGISFLKKATKTRKTYHNNTKLEFTAIEKCKVFDRSIDIGDNLSYIWVSKAAKRELIGLHDKFEVQSINTIKIYADTVFLINDCGTTSYRRLSFLPNAFNYNLIDYDNKQFTAAEIQKEIENIILTISGARVILLSSLEDLRPLIEKEPIEKGEIKLNFLTITESKFPTTVVSIITNTKKDCINKIASNINSDVFEIQELVKKPVVIFAFKSYSNIYDAIGHNLEQSLLKNENSFNILYNFTNFKNCLVNSKILMLSEGQYQSLLKKGVKLQTIREFVANEFKNEDFEEAYKLIAQKEIVNNQLVKKVISILDKTFINSLEDDHCLKNIFNAFQNFEVSKKNPQIFDICVKYELACSACMTLKKNVNSLELINKVVKKYPLIKYINFYDIQSQDGKQAIFSYVKTQDQLAVNQIDENIVENEVEELTF